ncbi:MAG: KH domain-containing protein [Verrucomicrobiota bacterium]
MEEFLRFVIGRLVEFPDEVFLTKAESPGSVIFYAAMRKSDVPKIIGKSGHTIQALRTLLNASAQRHGVKAGFEIVE